MIFFFSPQYFPIVRNTQEINDSLVQAHKNIDS